jgi:hypothetical protein
MKLKKLQKMVEAKINPRSSSEKRFSHRQRPHITINESSFNIRFQEKCNGYMANGEEMLKPDL